MKTSYSFVCFVLGLTLIGEFQCQIQDNQNLVGERSHSNVVLDEGRLENEDSYLTVSQIIAKYGYPVEVHTVTTADGYILELHRIPYGKKAGAGPGEDKPVAFLQHGLLCDSSNWILNNEDKAVAYALADAGYDVWMGNYRGNTYSKKHVTLDPKGTEFWQFSWNEMGKYDIPAVLTYVLEVTGQPNLHYIGHSMGTTGFFVAMATHPELNSKIRLMSALAPIAYVEHMSSPINLIAPYCNMIDWILTNLGMSEFLPSNWLMDFLGATICRENSLFQPLCSNVLFLVAGYNVEQLNKTSLPIVLSHTPSGASVKSLVHYAQGVNTGLFRQYNHGRERNLELYGQEEPPEYDISKITAPIALFYAQNDWLGPPSDVYRFAEQLPNLVHIQRIRHDKYNHLDFLWAIDNDKLIVKPMLDFMKYFESVSKKQ